MTERDPDKKLLNDAADEYAGKDWSQFPRLDEPTAERDRLAKLMDETPFDYDEQRAPDGCTLITPDWKVFADRLIAAGVHLDLDVERLARALHRVYHDGKPGEPSPHDTVIYCGEDAAAIAAAYREDAG